MIFSPLSRTAERVYKLLARVDPHMILLSALWSLHVLIDELKYILRGNNIFVKSTK